MIRVKVASRAKTRARWRTNAGVGLRVLYTHCTGVFNLLQIKFIYIGLVNMCGVVWHLQICGVCIKTPVQPCKTVNPH